MMMDEVCYIVTLRLLATRCLHLLTMSVVVVGSGPQGTPSVRAPGAKPLVSHSAMLWLAWTGPWPRPGGVPTPERHATSRRGRGLAPGTPQRGQSLATGKKAALGVGR